MKRTVILISGLLLAFAVGILIWPELGSPAQAQQNCPSFHAILQGRFPLEAPLPLRDGDGWGGNIYGYLDEEPLVGVYSGNDGTTTWHQHVGMGKDGTYKFAFGPIADDNTFTIIATQATFPNPPGKFPLGGMYHSAWKISEGTGKFQYASGHMIAKGPYLVWTLNNSDYFGRWNAEITGNICVAR